MEQADKEVKTPVCFLCNEKIEKHKSFTCRKCRKTPFCLDHLDREYKVCPGCAAERRIKNYNDLLGQEKAVRAFLRLAQFIFMVSAFLFAAGRFFDDYVPEILKENIFYKHLFVWGGLAIGGMLFCYVILYSQRKKVSEVEEKLQDHRVDSRYMRR
ncbi:MAG TPA: hypothetical protein VN328_12640 [Thermodesulfovibrionales bacterium]|nr:hypothetical protein [Thermodesulfovibrionales bacterium]